LIAKILDALVRDSKTITVVRRLQLIATRKAGVVRMLQQRHGSSNTTVSDHASMVTIRAIPCRTVTPDVAMIVLDMGALVKATWTTMEPLPKVQDPDIVLGVLQRQHKNGTWLKIVIMNAH